MESAVIRDAIHRALVLRLKGQTARQCDAMLSSPGLVKHPMMAQLRDTLTIGDLEECLIDALQFPGVLSALLDLIPKQPSPAADSSEEPGPAAPSEESTTEELRGPEYPETPDAGESAPPDTEAQPDLAKTVEAAE